jgi:hypothetical protein
MDDVYEWMSGTTTVMGPISITPGSRAAVGAGLFGPVRDGVDGG